MRVVLSFVSAFLFGTHLPAQEQQGAVQRLWQIAYQFHPQPDSVSSISHLPMGQDALDIPIVQAMVEDSTACREPLLLITMRLYLAQLRCCNQSYDIANHWAGDGRSSVADAFLRLTAPDLAQSKIEFYSSGAPYEYFLAHKQRFHSKEVQEEADRIAKETCRIAEGH